MLGSAEPGSHNQNRGRGIDHLSSCIEHVEYYYYFLSPTTSVSTAATLLYAIRAGITAGAGTRLVL